MRPFPVRPDRRSAVIATVFLVVGWTTGATHAVTFTVDTTADSASLSACTAAAGDCSLRGAVAAANAAAGADTITFAIPAASDAGCNAATGVCRIGLNNAGLQITQSLAIDGFTQSGAQPNTIPAPGANNAQLKIELGVASLTSNMTLFDIQGASTTLTVRGLALLPLTSNLNGLMFFTGNGRGLTLEGSWLGVNAAGNSEPVNAPVDYFRFDLQTNWREIRIGGPNAADRNVLAGANKTNPQGEIFGSTRQAFNVVGVSATPTNVLFQGNLVGYAPDGVRLRSLLEPIVLSILRQTADPVVDVLDNRFARSQTDQSCHCAGGALELRMSGEMQAQTVRVQRNIFGMAVDGTRHGMISNHIYIHLGHDGMRPRFLIGGTAPGEGNTFVGATEFLTNLNPARVGAAIATTRSGASQDTFVEVVGNRMLGNQGLGFDLLRTGTSFGGHNPNDPGDADTGFNRLQNFPEISAFNVAAGNVQLTYKVDSTTANSDYPLRVDFYKANGDEGEAMIGSDVYAAIDAQVVKSVSLPVPTAVTLTRNDVIVAVATDAQGRSSEFSFSSDLALDIQPPLPGTCGASDTLFCTSFESGEVPRGIRVPVIATHPLFTPNGKVTISSDRNGSTCLLDLVPTATPNTSSGVCVLTGAGAPGAIRITATHQGTTGAFAMPDGSNVVVSESFTLETPP